MLAARAYVGERPSHGDTSRHSTVSSCPIAELPQIVGSPTPEFAFHVDGAGVAPSGRNRAETDGGRDDGGVNTFRQVSRSQLTAIIGTPASDASIRGQGTRVRTARRHGDPLQLVQAHTHRLGHVTGD